MGYLNHLVQLVNKRSKHLKLEGLVEGKGSQHAKIMFIGEAPGVNEVKYNEPFIGKSGKQLNTGLETIGLNRNDIYLSSIVRSRPYHPNNKNRKPTKQEIFAHAPLVDWEIKEIQPKIIVTLGKTAYERITGHTDPLSQCHGKKIKSSVVILNQDFSDYTFSEDTYIIVPFYHPAAVFYNATLKQTIRQDWEQLNFYLNNET